MANFIDRVTDVFDLITGRSGRNVDGNIHDIRLFTQHSAGSSSGQSVNLETILREPTTMTCITVISQGISQLPAVVKRKTQDGKYELVRDSSIAKLLSKPNNFQSASEFKASIVTSLLVSGNAYVRIIRSGVGSDPADGMNVAGEPRQLVVMDSDEISIGADGLGFPRYNHDNGGLKSQIANENMVHIRDFTTFTAQGQSRVMLAAEIVGSKIAADRLVGTTFRRGINPKYRLKMEGAAPSVELVEKMQEQLTEQFGPEGTSSGGAIILHNADIDAIKGLVPADTDLRELRDQLKNEIAAALRVPAFMVGGSSTEKFNNVRQKLASFHRDTLNPIITVIEEALTLKLIDSDDEYVCFDVSDLLKGDVETETKLAIAAAGGPVMSVNESRVRLGLNPIDGEEFNTIRATGPEPEETSTGGEDGPRAADREGEQDA